VSHENETTTAATPSEALDRLVWERGHIGGVFLMVAIIVMFVGELVLQRGHRPGISIVQTANVLFIWLVLALARDPTRRTLLRGLLFATYVFTAVAIGLIGIFAGDAAAMLIVLVGFALGFAILVPWGPVLQAGAVIVSLAVGSWALIVIDPKEFWLQPIGSILPTFAVSVLVAHLVRRGVLAVAEADIERRARERGLYLANRRLETEIRNHEKTEEMLRFALLELDHRVKNMLTSLQSIAEQTLETAASPSEFAESFRGRIRAMANIHAALAARRLDRVDLRELVDLVVGPYRLGEESVRVCDTNVSLSSDQARTLGTALHELATNAAKYGALSTPKGRLEIDASVEENGGRHLRLSWRERGGPPVRESSHRGLGTKLIEVALAYESGGSVRLEMPLEGVRCEVDMPLDAVRDG